MFSVVKWLQPGMTVSYGRHFTVKKPCKVATMSIGYADGLPRIVSNKIYMFWYMDKLVQLLEMYAWTNA